MDLVAHCRAQGWHRLAFIGATKHAGKTTALNAFIAQAAAAGVRVGACSVGLDGERLDTILGVAKPAVWVPAGTLIASAERALDQAEARLEWLEVLPIESPLGAVALVQTVTPGKVLLAGVRQRAHVELVLERLTAHGAAMCLVDGAFDRIAAAAPQLVDAAVIAIGAVAGKTVADVVRVAQPLLQRFQLPELPAEWKEAFRAAHEQGEAAWLASGAVHRAAGRHVLFGLTSQADWGADTSAVYLPGAVTDSVAADLLRHQVPLTIAAAHPAQVLLTSDAYRKLYRAGHQLYVWTSLPVAAVAANPHSITGYDLPAGELQEALRALAGGIPVFDALAAGGM